MQRASMRWRGTGEAGRRTRTRTAQDTGVGDEDGEVVGSPRRMGCGYSERGDDWKRAWDAKGSGANERAGGWCVVCWPMVCGGHRLFVRNLSLSFNKAH